MKKILFFAVLLSFAVNTTVQAQLRDDPYDLWDVLVGGRVGVSASTLTKNDGDYKIWPCASIFTEVFVNPSFSMTFEAGYSRKGSNNVTIDGSVIPAEDKENLLFGPEHPYTYNLDYINTTYLVKYLVKQRIGFYTGLCFSTLVSARAKVDGISTDIRDEMHGGDFSIPVGVEIILGKNLLIDGRWNWSPRRVTDTSKAQLLLGKARNQFFSLTVGYRIQVF